MVKAFGDFEFDDQRRSLKANGQQVVLKGQALDLLDLLLERPGELVTREEIERRLWPDRTVDFTHSLDVVVSRLRTVLGDKGPSPRYIETVPRRGYRFIEPVTTPPEVVLATAPRHARRRLVTYAVIALLAALLAILFVRTRYDKFVPSPRSQASPTASPPSAGCSSTSLHDVNWSIHPRCSRAPRESARRARATGPRLPT